VRYIIAAHLIFFGFGVLGMVLFWLMLGPMIALKASASLAWLPILVAFIFFVLAFGSYVGILVASTKRFFRAGSREAEDGSEKPR
jgi:membrane protein implicated in regulation of membrane protease activity